MNGFLFQAMKAMAEKLGCIDCCNLDLEKTEDQTIYNEYRAQYDKGEFSIAARYIPDGTFTIFIFQNEDSRNEFVLKNLAAVVLARSIKTQLEVSNVDTDMCVCLN